MKRYSVFLIFLLLAALPGCRHTEKPGVTYPEPENPPITLSPVSLDPEEQQLLGSNPELPSSLALSFRTEVPAGAWKAILFRMENGSWEDIAGGSWQEIQSRGDGPSEGKLLLRFSSLWEPFFLSFLDGTEPSRTEFLPYISQVPQGSSQVALLSAVTQGEFETLIPLAVQVVSHQSTVPVPGMDILEHPENYDGQGYEEIFLLAFALRQTEN